MNSNNEQKVSKMILDVAGQFIQMVESEEERQTHLDIACAAWNISILPKNKRDREYKEYFNKMKRLLNDPQLIKYFEEDLNGLIDAKIDLFPNENKPIVSAIIENINSDEYRVTAAFAREQSNSLGMATVDRNHNEIKIGSRVKVLFIEPGFISTFPFKEAIIMKTMINKTFEVVGIEHGKAMVYQPFDSLNGFTLALASEEMELVDIIEA